MLSKILEYKLLNTFQSGFRTGHIKETRILKLSEDIEISIEKKIFTALILFDFSRAFNTVNDKIFLDKLVKLGLSNRIMSRIENNLLKLILRCGSVGVSQG